MECSVCYIDLATNQLQLTFKPAKKSEERAMRNQTKTAWAFLRSSGSSGEEIGDQISYLGFLHPVNQFTESGL